MNHWTRHRRLLSTEPQSFVDRLKSLNFGRVKSLVKDKAETSFQNDPNTWKDAFRTLVGMKPTDKLARQEEMRKQQIKEFMKMKADPNFVPKPSELVLVKTPKIKTSDPIWKRFSDILSVNSSKLLTQLLTEEKIEKIVEKREEFRDKVDSAKQTFETSQHPVVNNVYSVYEKIGKDNSTATTIRQWRSQEPDLTFDDSEIIRTIEDPFEEDGLIPQVLKLYLHAEQHLGNDDADLAKYCGEKASMGIRASGTQRATLGQRMSDSILSIGHTAIVTVENEKAVVRTMVQQIDCLYNAAGEIVEGREDKVVAVHYVFVISRKYFEEEFRYRWFCEEIMVAGQQAYI